MLSGFLVAGWRIIVQIGLALLQDIQDELARIDTRLVCKGMKDTTDMTDLPD